MPNPTSKLNLVINGTTTQLDIHDANAVDLTNNQTVAGNKEFTGTTTAHDLVPSATDTYNLGSSSYQWNNAYIKSLTINGVACGDILTHNASEFVNVTGAQTIGGVKTFSNEVTMFGRDINLMSRLHYGKNSNPSASSWQYLFFRGNTAIEGYTDAWYSGFLEQFLNTDGTARGRWLVRDTSENATSVELWASGSDKQFRPTQNGNTDLGTSTNKWKSFNGVNPGALSLPGDAYIDIDTTNYAWGSNFTFTPDYDGYCFLNIGSSSYSRKISLKTGRGEYCFSNQTDIFRFTFPVYKGKLVTIMTTSSGTESVIPTIRVFSCQGNV